MIVIYLFFIALIAYAIRLYMKRDEKPKLWDLREDMYYKKDPLRKDMYYKEDLIGPGFSFDLAHQNHPLNWDLWE